jgi:hypothetical protein
MVRLSFSTPHQGGPRQISAEAFVLRGGQLESQPQADPIAFSLNDGWELERDRFARVECPDRILCLFEEDGENAPRVAARAHGRGQRLKSRHADCCGSMTPWLRTRLHRTTARSLPASGPTCAR